MVLVGSDGLRRGGSDVALAEALAATKVKLLVAGLVVVGGGTVTYAAVTGVGPFADGSDVVESVPEGVDVVVYADPGVAQDQTTADLMNGLIDVSKRTEAAYDGPDDYQELLENASAEAELDVEALNGVAMYGAYPEENESDIEDGYFAMRIDSDWGEDEFVESFNDTEFEQREYEGYTVYVEQREHDEDRPDYLRDDSPLTWIGVVADGQYVVGTEQAVKDGIDVERGELDTFGGDLRTEYDNTREGYVRFAATVPRDRIPDSGMSRQFSAVRDIEVVSGSYYTEGDEIGMEARLTTGSESDADDLQSITDGAVATGKQMARTNESAALLDNAEVVQDGTVVVITFQSPVEDILAAVEAASEERDYAESESATGSGSASAGSDRAGRTIRTTAGVGTAPTPG